MPGRKLSRRTVAIGAVLAVALAAVIVVQARHPSSQHDAGRTVPTAGSATGTHTAASRVPPSTGSSPAGQVPADPGSAIGNLLDARAAALRAGDRNGWLAALDPSADPKIKAFRTAQGQVFDRVRTLLPAAWSYRVTGASALPAARRSALGAVAWLADVQLQYQLLPGGPRVQHQESLTIVRRAGSWRIAGDTDGPTAQDIWDLGPISHVSATRCLVVGASARRRQLVQLSSECGADAATVDAAWGTSWNRRTVLTVPDTLHQLAVLLGRTGTGTTSATDPDAGLNDTAAVTIGAADGPADEVLINGPAFDGLRAIGRRVVLTHELTHVATRATGSRSAPTWLEEGFADYVAYGSTGLPAEQVAGAALDAVRAGRIPARLPSPGDFDAAGDQAAAAYGQAWVAVGLIAKKAGSRARMKTFYQQAATGSGTPSSAVVNAAFAGIGLRDTAAFVPLWQARLRELAK